MIAQLDWKNIFTQTDSELAILIGTKFKIAVLIYQTVISNP